MSQNIVSSSPSSSSPKPSSGPVSEPSPTVDLSDPAEVAMTCVDLCAAWLESGGELPRRLSARKKDREVAAFIFMRCAVILAGPRGTFRIDGSEITVTLECERLIGQGELDIT